MCSFPIWCLGQDVELDCIGPDRCLSISLSLNAISLQGGFKPSKKLKSVCRQPITSVAALFEETKKEQKKKTQKLRLFDAEI